MIVWQSANQHAQYQDVVNEAAFHFKMSSMKTDLQYALSSAVIKSLIQ